jgi:hypothetical protein
MMASAYNYQPLLSLSREHYSYSAAESKVRGLGLARFVGRHVRLVYCQKYSSLGRTASLIKVELHLGD